MIAFSEYQTVLKCKDLTKMKTLLLQLRPDLQRALSNEKNFAKVYQLLAGEAFNKIIEKPQVRVSTKKVTAVTSEEKSKVSIVDNEAVSYPEHYPPILVQKLVEARRLVSEKAKISNSLFELYKANDEQGLANATIIIKSLQGIIDDIYKAKENFDNFGYLPKSWVDGIDDVPNDKLFVEKELNSLQAKLRGLKAKLRNPAECKQAGEVKVNKWRIQLKEVEESISKYKQKLTTLINIG